MLAFTAMKKNTLNNFSPKTIKEIKTNKVANCCYVSLAVTSDIPPSKSTRGEKSKCKYFINNFFYSTSIVKQ